MRFLMCLVLCAAFFVMPGCGDSDSESTTTPSNDMVAADAGDATTMDTSDATATDTSNADSAQDQSDTTIDMVAADAGDATTMDTSDATATDTSNADSAQDQSDTTMGMSEPVQDRLFRWLEGRFDSEAQSMTDPEYFAIQLHACEVSAPELGERVLYIEQATMQSLDAPYRQRLYVVEAVSGSDTDGVSVVYELNDEFSAIGLCNRDSAQTVFAAADVSLREGCDVFLTWNGTSFEGGTRGNNCESSLQGASYATSEVTVTEMGLDSWDRGYSAGGMQVWGAVSGAYQFVRRTDVIPEGSLN